MTLAQDARPILRAALPGDISAICDLLSCGSEVSADREKRKKDLKGLLERSPGSSAVFVAVREGLVLGLCSVTTMMPGAENRPAGIVENLVVHRDLAGQGIGGSLLGAVMTWSAKQGITTMRLVSGRGDAPALQVRFSRDWSDTGSICLRNCF